MLSDQRVRAMLPAMGLHPGDHVTGEVARNICLRTGSKAMIFGSIVSLGNQYVIDLSATDCQTRDSLAVEQVRASRKEDVLESLDNASRDLRSKLGESLPSIEKFYVPFQDAATPSVEAFQSFTTGVLTMYSDPQASIPFYQRAIQLDPNFARAYVSLSAAYATLGEYQQSVAMAKRAYQLRERSSEPERFLIDSTYFMLVTQDLEGAQNVLTLWARTYPRQHLVHVFLTVNYTSRGFYAESLAEAQEALRRAPVPNPIKYGNLMGCYIALNRLSEAKSAYQEARTLHLDDGYVRLQRYNIAFLERDVPEMSNQIHWAESLPPMEGDTFFAARADSEAFSGNLRKARDLTRRAVELARRGGKTETAAQWQLASAFREAEFGSLQRGRDEAASALALSPTRDVQVLAGLAFARSGDLQRAQASANGIAKQFPENAVIQHYWLPTIRGAIELGRGHFDKSLQFLERTRGYEMSSIPPLRGALYPVYLRAQAYLRQGRGLEAAAEFQAILDHPGITLSFPTGVMARLGLARSYALQGDRPKARAAYQQFFAIFKEADPAFAPLKEARSEYQRVK
ncbi:MAG: tetratricopeptide repeat protein [Candidatus Acidiferrum sp.]